MEQIIDNLIIMSGMFAFSALFFKLMPIALTIPAFTGMYAVFAIIVYVCIMAIFAVILYKNIKDNS